MEIKDITGEKFNRLTVVGRGKRGWLCRCDCGKEITATHYSLRTGKTKSCGCYKQELGKALYSKFNDYEELEDCYRGWDTKHENCFYFSKEDYETVKQYCWHFNDKRRYWQTNEKNYQRKVIKLHQLIMLNYDENYQKGVDIPDHINRNTNDNRRENLRKVSLMENSRNTKVYKSNTSGVKGVGYCKNKKQGSWRAYINDNNKKTIYKYFKTFEEAVEQRKKWEKEFGYVGVDSNASL